MFKKYNFSYLIVPDYQNFKLWKALIDFQIEIWFLLSTSIFSSLWIWLSSINNGQLNVTDMKRINCLAYSMRWCTEYRRVVDATQLANGRNHLEAKSLISKYQRCNSFLIKGDHLKLDKKSDCPKFRYIAK